MSNLAVNTNLSYFRLRKLIGILGMLLPVAAPLIACEYLPSISHSYYTVSGVLFTSVLVLVGTFLMSYRGYDPEGEWLSDNTITTIGGFFIIVVAVIPTPYYSCEDGMCGPTPIYHCDTYLGIVHFASAVIFFISMAYMSYFRFTKGNTPFDSGKLKRNVIYRTCGLGMAVTLIVAGVIMFCQRNAEKTEEESHLVFWIEVILLAFFGVSWLVKGKALADLNIQPDDEKEEK